LNKNNEAISDCEDAIKCNPDWIKAYYRKGLALSNMNDLEGADELALIVFKQGIEIAKLNAVEN
jgi:tetratricopeptide (TPR) repeat protein